nr:acyltransferase [Lachnospiraceae bacterium]
MKKRLANMELLRMLSMMFVVGLHFLGKGEFLTSPAEMTFTARDHVAWFAESFLVVAVNLYMLLSGYFVAEADFKVSRLVKTWLQVWFTSVLVGFV